MRIFIVSTLVLLIFGPGNMASGLVAPPTCPGGTRPATAADIPLMQAAGIQGATIGMCWPANDSSVGQNEGEAKQYLRSILCPPDGDNYGGKGPDGTIQGLDGKFAVCAAKFLKSALSNGTNVCIREGARTVEKQNSYVRRGVFACKYGAACEHPRGVAIDVNVRPNINDCRSYANLHSSAPQFGLSFYLGCRDAYHFRPTTAGCNAGGVVPPPSSYDFPYAANPTPPFDQALRRLLQPPPAPPPPIQSTSPAATQPSLTQAPPPLGTQNTTALPTGTCAPQFYCSGSTYYYRTSTCVDQIYQASSTMCASGSASSTNQNTNTNTNSTGTSTYDLIGQYADLGTTDIGTATPITLNPNTGNATALQPPPPGTVYAPSGAVGVQPAPAQGTFTSTDLGNSLPYGGPQSAFSIALNNIKNTLLNILSYLRPFGGQVPTFAP